MRDQSQLNSTLWISVRRFQLSWVELGALITAVGMSDHSATTSWGLQLDNTVRTIEIKLKQNWNKTVSELFCCSQNKTPVHRPWNVLAVLANHCRYTLSAKAEAALGVMTYVWRRRCQRWIVTRYCSALLFGVLTTRVTRYILPKVTPSETSYILPKLVTHMISMFQCLSD